MTVRTTRENNGKTTQKPWPPLEAEKWLAEEAKQGRLAWLKQNQQKAKPEESWDIVPQKVVERSKHEGEAAEQAAKLFGFNQRHKGPAGIPMYS